MMSNRSNPTMPVAFIPVAIALLFQLCSRSSIYHANAFTIQPKTPLKSVFFPSSRGVIPTQLGVSINPQDEEEREYARVRRGRRRRDNYYDDDNDDEPDATTSYQSTSETASRRRSSSGRSRQAVDWDYDDEYDDDDDEEYYDSDDDDYDDDGGGIDFERLFSDEIIPNPFLDSIDPDGTADRFPELAGDPRFWIEMLLFVAFLDFVSFAGPRNALGGFPFLDQ